jgi:hypothetical protein
MITRMIMTMIMGTAIITTDTGITITIMTTLAMIIATSMSTPPHGTGTSRFRTLFAKIGAARRKT